MAETLTGASADSRDRWLPTRLGSRLAAVDGIGRAAAALIALQLLWRAWGAFHSFFALDDFAYLYSAEHHALGWHYLTRPYNENLMPGQFLLVWLLQRAAPLNWPLVATVLVGLQLAVDVAVWKLLRETFADHVGVLLPFAVFLFSPLTMPSYLWWAAALQILPMLLAMAVALRAHLNYFRYGRRADARTALLAYAGGLLFWEKALLILPVVVGMSLLFPVDAKWRPVVRVVFRRRWRLWVGYAAVTAAYVAFYLGVVGWPLAGHPTLASRWGLVREMTSSAFLPSLLGGPWVGHEQALGVLPPPSTAVSQVLVVFVLLLVAVSLWFRPGAWRAWVLLLGYLALDALLLIGGRLHVVGPVIGRDTRYVADAALVTALAVGLAFLPRRDQPERGVRDSRLAAELGRPVTVALVIALYVGSCWVTTSTLVHTAAGRPTRGFVETARAELRAAGPGTALYDDVPPAGVLSPLLYRDDRYSRLLAGAPERPRFNGAGEQVYRLDDSGHLRPLQVDGGTRTVPGPVPGCGYAVGAAGATLQLQQPVAEWGWLAQVVYYTAQATPATLSVGRRHVPVALAPGLHNLYLPVTGPFDRVGVSGVPAGSVVCVVAVRVGSIAPA